EALHRPAPLLAPRPLELDLDASAWARAALEGEVGRVQAAPIGTRNVTLNHAAFRLGQLVGAGHLDYEGTRHALLAAANSTGLGKREAASTVRSGLEAGQHHPRG